MAGLVADADGNPPPEFAEVHAWLAAHVPPESGALIVHNDDLLGNVVLAPSSPGRELKAPSSVVLAVAGRPWTVEKLFTLSQIGMLRLNAEARFLDTKLEFAEIPFVDKKTAKQLRDRAA